MKEVENRLRESVDISRRQYGFQPVKSKIEPIFTLRMMQEKYLEKQKELHLVFVDLEKAYNRVPRVLIWWVLRKKGVEEVCVKAIRDIALNQTVPGARRRGRSKLQYMDMVKRNMKNTGIEEAATQDRRLWAASIATATHFGGQAGR